MVLVTWDFDLAHALEAVLENAFVPLRIEYAGAGLQRDLLSRVRTLPLPVVWSEM
jgi:hypothetical protein